MVLSFLLHCSRLIFSFGLMCLPAFSKAPRLVLVLLCRALALPHCMLCMLLAWPSGLQNICRRTRASPCSLPPPVHARRNTAQHSQGAPVAEAVEVVTQILLPPHQQCSSQKQQAGEVGVGEAVGVVCRSYDPSLFFLSFLKKKQRGRQGERRKRRGENRRQRKAQSLRASAALKYASWKKFPPSAIMKMTSGAGSVLRKHFATKPFKLLQPASFILAPCTPTPGVSTRMSVPSSSFLL